MPARKTYTKDKLVQVATDAVAGLSRRDLMIKYPAVSERVIRLLMHNGIAAEEWRAALLSELQATAGEVLLELRKAVREQRISPHSLPIALGILLDKGQILESRAAVQNMAVNVQINSYGSNLSKEELVLMLEGKIKPKAEPELVLDSSGGSGESIPSDADPIPQ